LWRNSRVSIAASLFEGVMVGFLIDFVEPSETHREIDLILTVKLNTDTRISRFCRSCLAITSRTYISTAQWTRCYQWPLDREAPGSGIRRQLLLPYRLAFYRQIILADSLACHAGGWSI